MLVFSFGSAEKGQLGNGTTGERITTGNKTSYDIETTPSMFFLFSEVVACPDFPSSFKFLSRSSTGRTSFKLCPGNSTVWHWIRRGKSVFKISINYTPNLYGSLAYVWGYNGYCRLGLGNQVDALKPKVVPQVMNDTPFLENKMTFLIPPSLHSLLGQTN